MIKGSSNRGFAAMDPTKQKKIASLGGKRAHEKGTAHQFTSQEAQAAGKKGGIAVSQDREHMKTIGRLGGKARGAKAQQKNPLLATPTGNKRPLHGMDMADNENKLPFTTDDVGGDGDFGLDGVGD